MDLSACLSLSGTDVVSMHYHAWLLHGSSGHSNSCPRAYVTSILPSELALQSHLHALALFSGGLGNPEFLHKLEPLCPGKGQAEGLQAHSVLLSRLHGPVRV